MNPQVAADIVQGHGRVRSFLEQITPGPARPMPAVAGFQKPDTTIPMQQRTVMQNAPSMPTLAGPSPVTREVAPCIGCNKTMALSKANLGGLRGVTIPTWLKWTFAIGLVVGGGYVIWRVSQR